MKKFLNGFFVTLGVMFLIQVLILVYLFFADPYNIKPFLFGSNTNDSVSNPESPVTARTNSSTNNQSSEQVTDKNPILNQNQEAALEAVGIDPTNMPTEVSPEQESCFIDAIGAGRVEAIKAGDAPTVAEIFAGRNCL